jgi:hypothetical protein
MQNEKCSLNSENADAIEIFQKSGENSNLGCTYLRRNTTCLILQQSRVLAHQAASGTAHTCTVHNTENRYRCTKAQGTVQHSSFIQYFSLKIRSLYMLLLCRYEMWDISLVQVGITGWQIPYRLKHTKINGSRYHTCQKNHSPNFRLLLPDLKNTQELYLVTGGGTDSLIPNQNTFPLQQYETNFSSLTLYTHKHFQALTRKCTSNNQHLIPLAHVQTNW